MKQIYILLVISLGVSTFSCSGSVERNVETEELVTDSSHVVTQALVIDEHTLSNYKDVVVSHCHLSLDVDFENEVLKGSVLHTLKNVSGAEVVIFDTKNLNIKSVLVDGTTAPFELGNYDELLGTPLQIAINKDVNTVEIFYETTEGAEALDWVNPKLTAGKENPYVFTQGQSIFTRTWVPIMDTPGLRITYSADITVPPNLLAVMSADNPTEKNDQGKYHFEMSQPVPCYLMALAVGNLEFVPVDERTGVYTEPEMIDACAFEFADMGEMVKKAEGLYGPYLWGRYDIIVLPPSFPFGGMENPRLTFATPTIIAGDRSLVSLVAHELAHSWSGNLVTNSTWNDFWLNEGFTVYFERRIMEDMYGKDYADMLAILGYQDLIRSIDEESEADQALKLKLNRRHPDVGMTDIAYEKGCFFLKMIEEASGRELFDSFLKNYFLEHKFQTINTEEFVNYLNAKLLVPNKIAVNVEEWIYESGVPSNCPVIESKNFTSVEEQLAAFGTENNLDEINPLDWSTHEWLHFIRNMPPEFSNKQLEIIDSRFQLTQSGNCEIACAWFEKSIRCNYEAVDQNLEKFLVRVGRRKFLTPLYRALKESNRLDRAFEIYEKARPNYHHVSSHTIDELLGYSKS
ncbi:MAG: M1 family metallopeptidase [Flavobacteriales bacterium]|nr:M1 family metallopeptidase [Flavobacteriales bacterium]